MLVLSECTLCVMWLLYGRCQQKEEGHTDQVYYLRGPLGVVVLSSQVDAVAPTAVVSMVVQACTYVRGCSVVLLVWAHACLMFMCFIFAQLIVFVHVMVNGLHWFAQGACSKMAFIHHCGSVSIVVFICICVLDHMFVGSVGCLCSCSGGWSLFVDPGCISGTVFIHHHGS